MRARKVRPIVLEKGLQARWCRTMRSDWTATELHAAGQTYLHNGAPRNPCAIENLVTRFLTRLYGTSIGTGCEDWRAAWPICQSAPKIERNFTRWLTTLRRRSSLRREP